MSKNNEAALDFWEKHPTFISVLLNAGAIFMLANFVFYGWDFSNNPIARIDKIVGMSMFVLGAMGIFMFPKWHFRRQWFVKDVKK